jgi:hypothetical protein
VNEAQIVAELGLAVAVALAVIRYWRQILALMIAVVIILTVIGAITVLSWCGVAPR